VGLAARCFIIQGGFTILGYGDISWAGPLALLLTKEAMDGGKLNNINPDVVDVHFLEALNTTFTFNNGALTNNTGNTTGFINGNATVGGIVETIGSDDIPGWSWALVATGIIAFFVAICVLTRKLGNEKRGNATGHFDPDEATGMRAGMQAPIDADEGVTTAWMDVSEEANDNYSDPLLPPAGGSSPRVVV
jgi:hypothetical protein